jgi:hypothetical protein
MGSAASYLSQPTINPQRQQPPEGADVVKEPEILSRLSPEQQQQARDRRQRDVERQKEMDRIWDRVKQQGQQRGDARFIDRRPLHETVFRVLSWM